MADTSLGMDTCDRREYLRELWRTQLGRPEISWREDFFAAGGSSMQVIEMLMTVTEHFGAQIDFAEFFKEPSIDRLSDLLEQSAP